MRDGPAVFASATTTTTALKISSSPTTDRTGFTAITATEHSPTLRTKPDYTIPAAIASARDARLLTTTATACSICSFPITWRSISRPLPNLPCKFPIATSKACPPTAVRAAFPCPHILSTATTGMERLRMSPRNPAVAAVRGLVRIYSGCVLTLTKMAGRTFLSRATPLPACF